jgi:Outer membrane protein beta-barrel domain
MKKTSSVMALVLGLALIGGAAAQAQTPAPSTSAASTGKVFASVSVGGSLQTQTFADSSTFPLFNETATVASNQSVGRGFVFDVSGGYRLTDHLAVGVGLWTQNGKGGATLVASLPDPLLFNHPKTVSLTANDLKQTDVGVNFQVIWMMPVTNKIDMMVYGGPSVIHVSQDIGSITVTPNTQNASSSTSSASKTTGKAGNVGVDFSYALNNRYGLGVFLRYAGGSVDLPSVSGLTVGGVQLGGGLRIKF